MSGARIYVVQDKETKRVDLIRANHPGTAIRHVASERLSVHVCGTVELLERMNEGLKVVEASLEASEQAPLVPPTAGDPAPAGDPDQKPLLG